MKYISTCLILTLCLSTVCPLIINAQPYGIHLNDKDWNYEKVNGDVS